MHNGVRESRRGRPRRHDEARRGERLGSVETLAEDARQVVQHDRTVTRRGPLQAVRAEGDVVVVPGRRVRGSRFAGLPCVVCAMHHRRNDAAGGEHE